MKTTTDMLTLRWRVAQWMLANAEGDKQQMHALRQAMRIESIDTDDILDEIELLQTQFAHRPAAALRDEVTRLWLQLKERP